MALRGLILGTGPSLSESAELVRRFRGLVFGVNNTFQHFALNVWIACDPTWHKRYSPVEGTFDKWHWDFDICTEHGYRFVEGVWHTGLWMADKHKISLNHGSGPQALNLACNQYECDEVILVGHDFHYPAGKPRHYFDDLSDQAGEYPEELRKFSKFDKGGEGYDLMAVYREISETPGIPKIWNATPGSKLPWFERRDLSEFL